MLYNKCFTFKNLDVSTKTFLSQYCQIHLLNLGEIFPSLYISSKFVDLSLFLIDYQSINTRTYKSTMGHCIPYIYIYIIILCSCLIGLIRIEDVACMGEICVYIVAMTARRGREAKRSFPFPPKYCWMNNSNNLYDYSIPHELKNLVLDQCNANIYLLMLLIYN